MAISLTKRNQLKSYLLPLTGVMEQLRWSSWEGKNECTESQKVQNMSSNPNQKIKPPAFDVLPDSAFVRESQLVYDPKHPEFPAPLPFSAATLWRKVADGSFPKPYKLSQRVTAWKVADIRTFLQAPRMGVA